MVVGVSLSLRVLVDLESLNMAESVGNVTKHRKAPVVVPFERGYRLVYVPVVSGMSLAHHYQRILAHYAKEMGLPVTRMSLEGYFIKFSDYKVIQSYYPEVAGKFDKKDLCGAEKTIVGACTVADVGGFLYTDGPVKRTSRFSFTYMMPALDAVQRGAVGVMPQIHVRYTPEAKKGEQALLYVDNASALYTLTFMLDATGIGVLETCRALGKEPGELSLEERLKRFEASMKALAAMLANMSFGAKRSRSLPHWRIESAVVAASEGVVPFAPSPGHSTDYIAQTVARAKAQLGMGVVKNVLIAYYADPELGASIQRPSEGAEQYPSLEEAIKAAADWARERLEA